MILNLTKPTLYVCQYTSAGGAEDIKSFKFIPGDNKIPSSEEKYLLKHPGIKRRIDLGILVQKDRMTEDLAKEAAESLAKEAKKKGGKRS